MAPARPTSTGPTTPRFSSSGYLTPTLIAAVCVAVLLAAYAHIRGRFHVIRSAVLPPAETAAPTGPGGQPALRLVRTAKADSAEPEFLSATFLPGRGMNLLQLTAFVPGRGEVALLASPSLADAARVLSGTGDDTNGSGSTSVGAAFLAPWAGHLRGNSTSTPGLLQGVWDDRRLSFPSASPESLVSTAGLLLNRPSDTVRTETLPDGQLGQAVFHAGSFTGNWPSSADVTVSAELSGKMLELTLTAFNSGTAPMPFGVGWNPLFSVPEGKRDSVFLRIPSSMRQELDPHTGVPTGNFVPTYGTPLDFVRAGGTRLAGPLDETFTDLQAGLLSEGPVAELRLPEFGYGLRVIPTTANTKTMHVAAPIGKAWVSITPGTNVDDPFGREWKDAAETGMTVLQPGATFRWKMRLEIFSVKP